MASIVWQAMNGGAGEVLEARGLSSRLCLVAKLSCLLLREFWNLVGLFPDVIYAGLVYCSLPSNERSVSYGGIAASRSCFQAAFARWVGVKRYRTSVVRNLRYADADRTVLDVYIPNCGGQAADFPVVMFTHGGIWASGEKWQFSPLGAFLAHHGVVTVLVQYTLFPQALAPQQAEEVSKALTWTMMHIRQFGGDPEKVFMMGHSAGAHLSALALWYRLNLNLKYKQAKDSPRNDLQARMPHCFLGMAGVYNIKDHYAYEVKRGVAGLSTMGRAMGGKSRFFSTSLLFASLKSSSPHSAPQTNASSLHSDDCTASPSDIMPPCILFSSTSEVTVPPESSIAFHKVLVNMGVKSTIAIYEGIEHLEFIRWDSGWTKLNPSVSVLVENIISIVIRKVNAEHFMRLGNS